ncbi:MAG: hypothetical protein NZ733_06250, partial [Aigarchaeota archaeon]|nr:hypothetical protein [Aigarchaeota archaeon]
CLGVGVGVGLGVGVGVGVSLGVGVGVWAGAASRCVANRRYAAAPSTAKSIKTEIAEVLFMST